jgi:hypothetical protein
LRSKAEKQRLLNFSFQRGDIRSVDVGRKFDATLMMFAVLGYQTENTDVLAELGTARRHLNSRWNSDIRRLAQACCPEFRASERSKAIATSETGMVRFLSGSLDTELQT